MSASGIWHTRMCVCEMVLWRVCVKCVCDVGLIVVVSKKKSLKSSIESAEFQVLPACVDEKNICPVPLLLVVQSRLSFFRKVMPLGFLGYGVSNISGLEGCLDYNSTFGLRASTLMMYTSSDRLLLWALQSSGLSCQNFSSPARRRPGVTSQVSDCKKMHLFHISIPYCLPRFIWDEWYKKLDGCFAAGTIMFCETMNSLWKVMPLGFHGCGVINISWLEGFLDYNYRFGLRTGTLVIYTSYAPLMAWALQPSVQRCQDFSCPARRRAGIASQVSVCKVSIYSIFLTNTASRVM